MSGTDDDDVQVVDRPTSRKRRRTSSPSRATSESSSSHSLTADDESSSTPPPSRSSPRLSRLKVNVHSKVEEGELKRVSSAVESPTSAPTTPSTKAAAKVKLQGGAKQMSDLLQAVKNLQLSTTQGRDWKDKTVKKGRVTDYLKSRLKDQQDKCTKHSAFGYLREHCINSDPERIKEYIDRLDTQHGLCILPGTVGYPQTKIPCSTVTVSDSDKKVNKVIGLLQVQTYNLAVILDEIKSDDELVAALEKTIADQAEVKTVGGHLCKQVCINSKHIRNVSPNVNVKFHEACSALWVIENELISFCHCPVGGGITCLAPGGLFKASGSCIDAVKSSINAVLRNTGNIQL